MRVRIVVETEDYDRDDFRGSRVVLARCDVPVGHVRELTSGDSAEVLRDLARRVELQGGRRGG